MLNTVSYRERFFGGGYKHNNGIALLRIVAIFWIILFHYADHGNVGIVQPEITFNWLLLAICFAGGGTGNCIFVIITGYLMVNKKFAFKRIVKLWLEVMFYSVVIAIICYYRGIDTYSRESIIKAVFPITYNQYWYMSSYVVLFFTMPFLNRMIAALNKKQHITLIAVFVVIFSVLPTLILYPGAGGMTGSNNIFPFFMCYFIGAFIKKYGIRFGSVATGFGIALLCICFLVISEIWFLQKNELPIFYVWDMCKTPVLFTAVVIFLCFKDLRFSNNFILKEFSESAFGIYLIHIGRLQWYIFRYIFDNSAYYLRGDFILHILYAGSVLFLICGLIDMLRRVLLEKPFFQLIDKPLKKVDSWVNSWF